MTPEEFRRATGVSRETLAALSRYADLLTHWQRRINLIGSRTLPDLWRRHMLDSAQLIRYLPERPGPVVDLGSGAGFPGLVLAIMGVPEVHLIESDQRKAAFLRTVLREIGLDATIHARRIETVPGFSTRAVTARALAPLPQLIALAYPFLSTDSVALFLKGQHVEDELTVTEKEWIIRWRRYESRADPAGCVLEFSAPTPRRAHAGSGPDEDTPS